MNAVLRSQSKSEPAPRNVAIVGATGAVGVEIVKCLEQRKFPTKSLRLLASVRSVGKKQLFNNQPVVVEPLQGDCFRGIDVALFSAGSGISKEFAPLAVAAG